MKKLFLAIIAFLFIISCNFPRKKNSDLLGNENSYIINGTVFGGNSKSVYLFNRFNKKIDSAKIKINTFLLQGKINKADSYYLQLDKSDKKHFFVLENSEYKIFLNDINSMIIGGELNSTFSKYKDKKVFYEKQKSNFLEAFYKQKIRINTCFKKIDSIRKIEKKLFNSFLFKNKNNVLASILIQETNLTSSEVVKLKTILKTNENRAFTDNLDSLYNYLKTTEEKDKILRRKPVPLFSGVNLKGNTTYLERVMRGNKVFLIDFWASWCAPCREISPKLKELYKKYQRKGFDILSVSEDRNVNEWKNAVFIDGLDDWHHVYDDYNRISMMFNVTSMPHMILLDEKGRIIKNKISIENLEKQLEILFDE